MLTLPAETDGHAEDGLPLTPEEALALFRAALGSDEASGLLLAVSGGPDSVAMLCLAAAARVYLPPLAVATVDHGLRPGSLDEAQMVKRMCQEIGLPHCILPWLEHPEGSVSQDAARKGRYALLMGHARAIEASHIVTAHTLDDQAETVLLRMAGGTGLAGLGAMRSNIRRGSLGHLRPFLEVQKSRVLATCDLHGWNFAKDPSNSDDRFKRVRLRALMPILATEGLTPQRLGILANRARRTDDAIEHVARRTLDEALLHNAADGGAMRLRAAPFYTEPFEIALRMMKRAILAVAPPGQQEQQIPLAKLESLLRDLRLAIRDTRPFRRTLAWAVIAHGNQQLEIRIAPPRRQSGNVARRIPQNTLATGHGVSR
ncbi:MesJ tRNA(Ile)-lysidine synthase MesJ [Rhabdaerophilaceae bacterium]